MSKYFKDLFLTFFIKIFNNNTKRKLLFLSCIFYLISYSTKYKNKAKMIISLFKNNHPYLLWWEKVIKKLDIDIKKKFIENFYINSYNGKYEKKRKEYNKKYGYYPPYSLIISLTSKCNFSCKGCWAKKYEDKSELPYEKWREVLTEAKNDMGIFSYYVTGGEPFMREDFFALAKEFSDCLFFTYTNASLLTDDTINKIKALGNIYPMVSINTLKGINNTELRENTNYGNLLNTMEKLSQSGIFWGTSTVATKNNIEEISSCEYYKQLSDKGAFWAWILDFVPSGNNDEIDLILTGEQKLELMEAVYKARNTYPIVTFDFYDAYATGGCTAAGQKIVHIASNGDVEPCPFLHLSTDNLKTTSLKDALSSKFLSEIRKNIPYEDGNCMRPCLILDRPEVLKTYVEKLKPKNTQKDFLNLLYDEKQYIKLYNNARHTKEIMDEKWKEKQEFVFFDNI